jgi:hypothetical protein
VIEVHADPAFGEIFRRCIQHTSHRPALERFLGANTILAWRPKRQQGFFGRL